MRREGGSAFGVVPGLVVLFALLVVLAAACTPVQRAASQAPPPAAPGDYVGAETCQQCHEDRFASYERSPHSIAADPRTPAARQACETCHGPGKAHVEAGGGKGTGMINLGPKGPASADVKNAQCLQCHAGSTGGLRLSRAMWDGSPHQSRGLTCTNCHVVHDEQPRQAATCGQCHQQIKAQLLRSSHHPIREGKMQCTDCHNPHGTVTEKLISANSVNEKCFTCHTEKRGPFLWEHAPVTENCLSCHTPHGSSHDKLLVLRRPWLCQTCHSNSRHPGTLYGLNPAQQGRSVYTVLNNRVFYRACSNCHSQIHGSNHPSGKSLAR